MQPLKTLAVAVVFALAPLRLVAQQPAPKPDAPAAQSDEKKADAQKDEKNEEKKEEKKDK
jgi:ribosomal protein L12E/L44/L45/RPP1/RPP2